VVLGILVSTVRRMDEILAAIAAAGLAAYVVAAMLALGLGSGPAGLVAALTDRSRTIRLVVAGAVIAPLGAWAVGSVVGLDTPLLVGLLVLGAAAGPPALGTLGGRLGDGDGLPAGHAVLLTAIGVVVLPLLLLGADAADVRASDVLLPLAAGVVLPLVGGIVARSRSGDGVARLLPMLERVALAALAVGGGLAFLLALPAILRALGTGAVLAVVLFGAVCVGAGALLGAGRPGVGLTLAVSTLQRNLPVAALFAITTFRSDPAVLAMVLGGVLLLRVLQIPFATANEEPSNDGRSKEQRARRHAVATVHARTP
jgi:predicted Na+-dependent transporter